MIARLWSGRYLVATLTRRFFQIHYRQSFAGVFWAILPPLGILGVGSLVFNGVAGVGGDRGSYALVTMAALVPWHFFSTSLSSGVPIVYSSSAMVSRLAFPRAVLPLSAVTTSSVTLGISTVMFVFLAYTVGDGLPATAAWFPILLMIEILFIVGVVLLGSAVDVFARDVRLAVPLAVQLWLLITPVMYPLNSVPANMRTWYLANPMTGLVESFRRTLVYGQHPDWGLLLPTTIGAALLLIVGFWYFAATEPRFADVI